MSGTSWKYGAWTRKEFISPDVMNVTWNIVLEYGYKFYTYLYIQITFISSNREKELYFVINA